MIIKSLMIVSFLLPVVNYNLDEFTEQEQAARRQFFTAGSLPYMRYENGEEIGLDPIGVHVPCCGEADAYETDEIKSEDDEGNLTVVLTCNDPRDCKPVPGKIDRPPGTEFKVPRMKILIPARPFNNTGHGWVFISINDDAHVICYSLPPGI